MNQPAQPSGGGADEQPGADPSHRPAPVDMATESIAGEEDPGATIDLAIVPPSAPPSGGKEPPRTPGADQPA
ncbi:hypothetical protein [Caldimonas tepidiphila]|uniref:hypothetical protein n=1 Tax=Caldimonas tepidiphila TaxID=2315841 RepID=UPI000E5BD94D|nr:hypothetical protein [Caldimonas tepidiphila]